jgi:hypothetical protein
MNQQLASLGVEPGCATLTNVQKLDGVKPRFVSRQHGYVGLGSAVGLLGPATGAAILIGSVVAMGAEVAVNRSNGNKDSEDHTYLVTMKPDFGDEFAIEYSFGRDPAVPALFPVGSRVRYGGYPRAPNQSFSLELAQAPAWEKINDPVEGIAKVEFDVRAVNAKGNEVKYLYGCYGTVAAGTQQLIYDPNTRLFAWQDPPAAITRILDNWK